MRLSQIKIVGFKSFVEPTKFPLAHALTAIVGPNGCGKSNSLDAVRWVMGESSARELRGGEMNDVLFSGSEQRASVSQCSVELIFENANDVGQAHAMLSGPYAQFSELSVKRIHHRETGTRYFLNNQPCRRRDVLDIFNGTGLGPRSYALISQGSINRIIEAKPEDLRHYIEEVAGIAGYRQKRKDTQARLLKAQANLNQLVLVKDELTQQYAHLSHQAEQAQDYQDLQQHINDLNHQIYQTKWSRLVQALADLDQRLRDQQVVFNQAQQALDRAQIIWVSAKETRQVKKQEWQRQTQAYHQLDKMVSRLEQQQDFIRQQASQQQALSSELQTQLDEAKVAIGLMRIEQADIQAQFLAVKDGLRVNDQKRDELMSRIVTLEQQQNQWQEAKNEADQQRQKLSYQCQQAEQSKQMLLRQIEQLEQQQAWLREHPVTEDSMPSLDTDRSHITELKTKLAHHQVETERLVSQIQHRLDQVKAQERLVKEVQEQWQTQRAEYLALQRLQQAWQAKAHAQLGQVRPQHEYQWLLEALDVVTEWQPAVLAWLGPRIHGIVSSQAWWPDQADASLNFVVWSPNQDTIAQPGSLAEVIKAPKALVAMANHIIRRDVDRLLTEQLNDLESFQLLIDQTGQIFYPQAWQASKATEGEIYLARVDDLTQLARSLPSLEAAVAKEMLKLKGLQAQLEQEQQAWQAMQVQGSIWQSQFDELEQASVQAQARRRELIQHKENYKSQVSHVEEMLVKLSEDLAQKTAALIHGNEQFDSITSEYEQHLKTWESLEESKQPLQQQHQVLAEQQSQLQQTQFKLQRQLEACTFKEVTLNQTLAQAEQGLKQLQMQLSTEQDPADELAAKQAELADLNLQLSHTEQDLVNAEHQVEVAESEAQITQGVYQNGLHELERLQQSLANHQDQLHQLRQQMQDESYPLPDACSEARLAQLSLSQLETQWRDAKKRLKALGNVNMTAIEERDQLALRLDELLNNLTDISESIAELSQAMEGLDKESREQLLDCFEQVNRRFADLFPSLFKGGKASLGWLNVNDDPLEDGLNVMAQPPGKRNTRIQLLSGGEKTLTALALIFAIFQMRPAPFCILDEVDAPLDDSNVIRFCGLVRSLSEKVQFVIITHNKTTMAMAQQLLGVSMNEPGVSRLVSVNLSKAVEMIGEAEA